MQRQLGHYEQQNHCVVCVCALAGAGFGLVLGILFGIAFGYFSYAVVGIVFGAILGFTIDESNKNFKDYPSS
jgi:outer membrane lipoprotein SlyB